MRVGRTVQGRAGRQAAAQAEYDQDKPDFRAHREIRTRFTNY